VIASAAAWNPNANDEVTNLAASGSTVFAIGRFSSMREHLRHTGDLLQCRRVMLFGRGLPASHSGRTAGVCLAS